MLSATTTTAHLRHHAMNVRGWMERYRFTLTTLALLILAAIVTDTADGSRFAAALAQTGIAPRDVVALRVFRAVYSTLLTSGGWELALALVAVAAFVGGLERRAGVVVAAATFWGAHLAALLAHTAIAWALHTSGNPLGTAVYLARDVGPSAGYVGCLGALVAMTRSVRLRVTLASAIWVGFAALLAADVVTGGAIRDVSADLAHLIAFGLGFASVFATSRARTRR